MRVFLSKKGHQIQTFEPLTLDESNFQVGKYEEKLKFDKIWGYQDEEIFLKQEH